MRCLKCGAATSVLETREYKGLFLRRSRQCHNEHKFASYEVHAGALDKRQILSALAGQSAREKSARRARAVLRNPGKSAAELAGVLGISATRVRQIRAAAQ
jgi:DNA-directed RNA polymerase sigma subunit (sigma70/sigma32)